MNKSEKIISNTIILYLKILLNVLISLATVPLILKALGISDYGLYNLVAGVVSMLAFLNASMTVSTQRYLSVAMGQGEEAFLNRIFNGAFYLHLALAIIIVLVLESVGNFLFDGFLNVENGREEAAKTIYHFLVFSIFCTVLLVPFNAALNAKENMLIFSIIGIFEALLRLILALLLFANFYDKLIFYGAGMACISFIILVVSYLYVSHTYKDCRLILKTEGHVVREMAGFSGWNALGAFAVISRNQITAIIINLFYGTIANAAYGIANQFNGMVNYFSSTFQKAINPQLMQSEGMRNRERLINISFVSCKLSTLVYSLVAVPLIVEMNFVLNLWLGNIPKYAAGMSQLILVFGIINQLSSGLMSAIQAVGKIRKYFLVISSIIIMNVPVCYVLLYLGYSPVLCLACFVVLEVVALFVRIKMSVTIVGINSYFFIDKILFRIMGCVLLPLVLTIPLVYYVTPSLIRFIIVICVYDLSLSLLSWKLCMSEKEKDYFKSLYIKVKNILIEHHTGNR